MATLLLGSGDVARARAFIEAQGLAFEPPFDDLVGVFEGEALVAAGARDRDEAGAVRERLGATEGRHG
jgi:[citrate (pro-3S)-lyase] ligase